MQPRSKRDLLEIQRSCTFLINRTANLSADEIEDDFELSLVVERQLERIGESLRRLRDRDQSTAGQIPRIQEAISMRNFIAHEYYDINWKSIRRTLDTSIPALLEVVSNLLEEPSQEPK